MGDSRSDLDEIQCGNGLNSFAPTGIPNPRIASKTTTRQNPADIYDHVSSDSGVVCRRCNSLPVFLDGEPKHDEVNEIDKKDVDEVDNHAKVATVTIRCHCHKDIPFLARYIGTYVLERTVVVKRYLHCPDLRDDADDRLDWSCSPAPTFVDRFVKRITPICLVPDARTTSQATEEMGITEVGTTDLYLRHPSHTQSMREEHISLGIKVVTVRDEHQILRQFVKQVSEGEVGADINLRGGDELLALNNILLVDANIQLLKTAFANINIEKDINLVTRRYNTDVAHDYEYMDIRASIVIEQTEGLRHLKADATILKSSTKTLDDGDFMVLTEESKTTKYIQSSNGYLQNVDESIEFNPQTQDSTQFKVDVLTYSGCIGNMCGRETMLFQVFRWKSEKGSVFLSYSDPDKITLKALTSHPDYTPTMDDINNNIELPECHVRDIVFLSEVISTTGMDTCVLQPSQKLGHFVKFAEGGSPSKHLEYVRPPDQNTPKNDENYYFTFNPASMYWYMCENEEKHTAVGIHF